MSLSRAARRREEKSQRKAQRNSGRLTLTQPHPLEELRSCLEGRSGQCLRGESEHRLRLRAGEQVEEALASADAYHAFSVCELVNRCWPTSPDTVLLWSRWHEFAGRTHLSRQLRAILRQVHPGQSLDRSSEPPYDEETAALEHYAAMEQHGQWDALLAASQYRLAHFPDSRACLHASLLASAMLGDAKALPKVAQLYASEGDFPSGYLLFRLQWLRGCADSTLSQRLQNWPEAEPEAQAELAHLQGDDARVLQLWQLHKERASGPLCHYAAVSLAHQNRWNEARECWREARRLTPGLIVAQRNLANAELPAEERLAAWPFEIQQLLDSQTLEHLLSVTDHSTMLDAYPNLLSLLPLWLDRGGPVGNTLGWRVLLQDKKRRAGWLLARLLKHVSPFLPSTTHEFSVDNEPVSLGSEELDEVDADVLRLLQSGAYTQAELLARQALQSYPDHAKLVHHLCVSLSEQGRESEMWSLQEENHRKHPDYFFAAAAFAARDIRDGRFDEAQERLSRLSQRDAFKLAEFRLLCELHFRLAILSRDQIHGEDWMRRWEQAESKLPEAAQKRPEHFTAILQLREAAYQTMRDLILSRGTRRDI